MTVGSATPANLLGNAPYSAVLSANYDLYVRFLRLSVLQAPLRSGESELPVCELSPTTRLVPSAFHPTRALRSLRRPRHSFHLLLRHPYFLFAPSRAHSSPPSYPALNTTSRHLFLASPSAALRPSSRCVHRRPKTNASGAAPRAAARASSISAAATRSATSPPLTTQRKVERQHTGLCTHLDTTPSRHGSLQCDCKAVEGSAMPTADGLPTSTPT